jgi:predicted Zn-dependent peptidase
VPSLSAGPLTLVDRPGSVQSSLRLALPAVGRTHPDHAALQLANLLFGGYFSSRWVENIREDKGYTYGPHSAVEHSIAGSLLTVSTEVATAVTAPALLETWYELGRLAVLPPTPEELEQARQYALGTLQLGMSTQAGLAGLASTYAGYGLRLDYLSDYSARLAAATRDDVAAAAARYLAPAKAVTVVLGDAEVIESSVAALAAVQRETLPAAGSDEGAAAGSTGA